MRAILTRFCVGMAVFLVTACSLKDKDQAIGVQVRLEPSNKAQNLLPQDLQKGLQRLSLLSTSGQSIDDLDCFSVNVRGGDIPTSSICGGVQAGVVDGPLSDVHSVFEPLVPSGDGLIFEALGSVGGGCSGGGAGGIESADTVYKLGTVTANTTTSTNVFIPVDLDLTQTFGCDNGPFPLFEDDFSYTAGALGGTVNWTDGGCGVNPALASGVINIAPIVNQGCSINNNAIDFLGKPFTKISFRVVGGLTLVAGAKISFGVTNGTTTLADGYGCTFNYTTGNDPTQIQVTGASFIANFAPFGGSPSGTFTIPNGSRFVCEIQRESSGNYSIRSRIMDSTETIDQITPYSETAALDAFAETSTLIYLSANGNATAFGIGALIDDMKVEQATTRQF